MQHVKKKSKARTQRQRNRYNRPQGALVKSELFNSVCFNVSKRVMESNVVSFVVGYKMQANGSYLNLQMLPLNTNIRLAYSNGKDDEQNFIQNLSLFLCTFLKEHGQLIEKRLNLRETLMEVGFLKPLASEIVLYVIKTLSPLF